ncbi:MAG: hypothetical protein ACNA8W_17965, partial [Bradymonadaceae bacterium]
GYQLAWDYAWGYFDVFEAVSSEDFKYVGTLEEIDAPTATEITLTDDLDTSESLSGAHVLRLDENYFTLIGAETDDLVRFTVYDLHEDVIGIVQFWNGDGDFIEEIDVFAGDQFNRQVPESGLQVVVDWFTASTAVSTFEIGAVVLDLTARDVTVPAGDEIEVDLDGAPANSVVAVSLAPGASGNLRVSVLNAAGDSLGRSGLITTSLTHYAFHSAGGDYTLLLENTSTTDVDATVLVEFIAPEVVGNLSADPLVTSAETALSPWSFNFFLFEESRAGDIVGFLHDGTDEPFLYYTLYDSQGERIYDDVGVGANNRNLRHYNELSEGPILVLVENYTASTPLVTITGRAWTPVDLPEPPSNGYKAEGDLFYNSTDTLEEDGSYYLRVLVEEPLVADGSLVANDDGMGILLVWDTDLNWVRGFYMDGDQPVRSLVLDPGTYLFEIIAIEELVDGFTLDLDLDDRDLLMVSPGTNVGFSTAVAIASFDHTITGVASEHNASGNSWWKFTVDGDDPIAVSFTVTNIGGFDWGSMLIIDDTGELITTNSGAMGPILDYQEVNTVGAVFQPGETYYVVLGGLYPEPFDEWYYTVTFKEITGHELERESNDSFASANDVSVGGSIAGTIVATESDFYTFDVTQTGDYSLSIVDFPESDDASDVVVYLYDEDHDLVPLDASMGASLTGGITYYIEITKEEEDWYGNSYLLFVHQD